jgi:uncharacterized membrane protein YhiD involved in acid resistance
LHEEREIEGLTTAAGIWMPAAIGVVFEKRRGSVNR